jgi:5-methylcytosine-specific restriction endonuclease McrA
MKAKKEKPLYDERGRWVEERGRIKGAIRRSFRLSPQMKEVLKKARVELPPALKINGEPGKKNQVRYTCAICKQLFSQKNVQVDHLTPVVPLWKPEASMSYDEIVRGVFCALDNLQVICSTPMKRNNGIMSCHKLKTDEENFIRDELKKVINLLDHTGEEIDALIVDIKAKYMVYLQEREEKKKAKLARRNRIKNQ